MPQERHPEQDLVDIMARLSDKDLENPFDYSEEL
jgi:hypothetical protein